MAQQPLNFAVTVSSSGTRVPLVSPGDANQFVRSALIEAYGLNAGEIYIGGSNVSATQYSRRLVGSDKDRDLTISGDNVDGAGGSHRNCIDLSKWYVDAATSGDKVMVTIEIQE